MKTLTLVLAFAAVAAAQKPLKASAGKHNKPAYIAASPGAGGIESAPAYQAASPQASISNHGGFGGGSLSGKGAKPVYPLLLSDTRTLNQDGTINFNYQADNGLQQGETVDPDGTRRGFYSYPGADGKPITVKYSAGKNGFVAEGAHLPTQPQPYTPKQESHDIYSSGKQGSSFGGGHHGSGHYSAPVQHHGGHHGGHHAAQYRPQAALGGHHGNSASVYSHNTGPLGGHGGHGSQGGHGQHGSSPSFANFPDFSNHFSSSLGGKGFGGDSRSFIGYSGPNSASAHPGVQFQISHQQPQAQTQYNNVVASPRLSSGADHYSGAGAHHGSSAHGATGHPGGSQSFSSLGPLGGHGGSHHGGASLSDLGSSLGPSYSGPMFTNANPYQPTLSSHSAPVNAGFDLGNGGHFSINFAPGVGQEYNPSSGDFPSQGLSGHQGGQSSYAGSSGQGGAQGRY